MKSYLLIAVISLLSGNFAIAQDAKNQKKQDKYEQALAIVESSNFEFVATKANPQGARQIDLTTNPNYLRVKGRTGEAEMPYFGRAFSAGYGTGGGGIEFNDEFTEYNIAKNPAKYRITIQFKIRGGSDTYSGTFSISNTENVSLTMSSNNKQVISYYGVLKKLE